MTFATADNCVEPTVNPLPTALVPSPPALLHYDEACRAVAEARTVDDAREISAHAEAVRAYARQAKNRQLELDAAEIRIRAERRLGELMAAQRDTVGVAKPPSGKGQHKTDRRVLSQPDGAPTLAEAGIDKNLAHRARTLAAVAEEKFETLLDEKRRRADRRVVFDPGRQAEADAAPEIRIERNVESVGDDYAAIGGLEGLAAQNAALMKRLIAVLQENGALRDRVKLWKERARQTGWKGPTDV